MKKLQHLVYLAVFAILLCLPQHAQAQLDTPRGSQHASVSQTVGITKMYIHYSRPSVRDREIWGKLVPYGMNNLGFGTATSSPWRAGADENTIFKVTNNVTIGGKTLAAGKYGLHMIIHDGASKATVIFSKNHGAWGSYFYDPSEDALRVDVNMEDGHHVEQLTYGFEKVTPTSATAVLSWGKKRVPFTVEVNVTDIVLTDIRSKLQNQPGFNRQSWEQAANFASNNGGDLNEALGWINNAIAGQFYSQQNFNNTQIKAGILAKMGKQAEADAAIDAYMENATVLERHQYGRTLIAQGKKDKALDVFKMNAKFNKGQWPVDYGLARGYSALGDYKKALKHLLIAQKRVPDAGNKQAIAGNIEKLKNNRDIN
jgi:hypothetical protein